MQRTFSVCAETRDVKVTLKQVVVEDDAGGRV